MRELIEKLKRMFQPRTPSPPEPSPLERIEHPSADRPPPPEAAPSLPPAPDARAGADDVSEVRALLEAVAEAPIPAAAPEIELPIEAVTPPLPQPPTDELAAADALVLTLATPAATFTVARAAATIGRGQENTIRLDDLSVSRRHARIAYKQGGYWLSDLGSMGGTWVDGTRLSAPHRIASGQVIDIGLCRLTVSAVGGAAEAAARSTSKPRSGAAGQTRRAR